MDDHLLCNSKHAFVFGMTDARAYSLTRQPLEQNK
jgi:hypothetical protein